MTACGAGRGSGRAFTYPSSAWPADCCGGCSCCTTMRPAAPIGAMCGRAAGAGCSGRRAGEASAVPGRTPCPGERRSPCACPCEAAASCRPAACASCSSLIRRTRAISCSTSCRFCHHPASCCSCQSARHTRRAGAARKRGAGAGAVRPPLGEAGGAGLPGTSSRVGPPWKSASSSRSKAKANRGAPRRAAGPISPMRVLGIVGLWDLRWLVVVLQQGASG